MISPVNIYKDKEANFVINRIYQFLGENYIIKIGKTHKGDEIMFEIEQENNCSKYFYIALLSLEQFIKLGKSFRQFDNIDEIISGLINIFKKEKKYFNFFSVFLSEKTENNIILNIKAPLINGKEEIIKIKYLK